MNMSKYLVKPTTYPTTLYSKNGDTVRVYKGQETEYLNKMVGI